MAKKTSEEPAEPESRKGRQSATISPDDLKSWAKDLDSIAATMRACAANMETLKIESYEPVVGNWNAAMKLIGVFLGEQVIGKLVGEAAKRGLDYSGFMGSTKR